MIMLLVLLAQAIPPLATAPQLTPTPAPSVPSPSAAVRDKMSASTDKQREAVKRQTRGLGLHQDDEPTGFFTTPWPRPQPVTPPAPAVTTQPVSYKAARFNCEPLAPAQIDHLVSQAARREQLAPELLRAVIRQESAGYPCAVSRQGAAGLMQLMPSTARQFAVRDAFNPAQNVGAGAKLLRQLIERYPGDLASALAAYNAGTAPVDQHGGVPPYAETQNYVQQILGWMSGASAVEQ